MVGLGTVAPALSCGLHLHDIRGTLFNREPRSGHLVANLNGSKQKRRKKKTPLTISTLII